MENLAYDYIPEEFDEPEVEPDFEIIGGEKIYMTAAPDITHGIIVSRLNYYFVHYIEENDIDAVSLGDNTDVYFSDEDHFKPDLSIVCDVEIISNGKRICGAPDLVVEVLSESTMKNDLGRKKDAYEKYGVKEYWIVDPWSQRVDVYLLENEKFVSGGIYKVQTEDTELKSEIKVSIFEDLTIDLKKVFKRWFDN